MCALIGVRTAVEIVSRCRPRSRPWPVHQRLTRRENELAALLAEGLSTSEAAARLGLSPATVRTHRRNIMDKLGVHNWRSVMAQILFEDESAPDT